MGVISSWFLFPVDLPPPASFLEHFLAFWYNNMFQAYLVRFSAALKLAIYLNSPHLHLYFYTFISISIYNY